MFALGALVSLAATASAEVLTQTKYLPFRVLDSRGPGFAEGQSAAFSKDMREIFQRYPEPGPTATFTISLPEPDERRPVDLGQGNFRVLQTFKTQSGEPYSSIFDLESADDFVYRDFAFEVRLFPGDAPLTVANFMTYAHRGEYNRTIVHRSPQAYVVQAGGFRFSRPEDNTEAPLWRVQAISPIPMEFERPNTAGTIAMARPAGGNATNQWFFNIRDNSNIHIPQLNNAYAAFGEITPEGLDVLREINDISRFNLGNLGGSFAVFEDTPITLPFNVPDYTTQLNAFVSFDTISVNEGNPDGIEYSWEPVLGTEEDPVVADVDSFDIRFDGTRLLVDNLDTGQLVIEVTGTFGDQALTFPLELFSEDPRVRQYFSGQAVTVSPGHTYAVGFLGEFDGREFPWIFHPHHHFLFAATEAQQQRYHFYDPRLQSWIFTRPARVNYFYIHRLDEWLFYAAGSGTGYDPENPDFDDRWFYRFPVVDEDDEEIEPGEWVIGNDL